MNNGWDHDWSQDAYSASEHMPVSQELLSFANDGHQEMAMSSFENDNKFGFPFNDGLQDYQV